MSELRDFATTYIKTLIPAQLVALDNWSKANYDKFRAWANGGDSDMFDAELAERNAIEDAISLRLTIYDLDAYRVATELDPDTIKED